FDLLASPTGAPRGWTWEKGIAPASVDRPPAPCECEEERSGGYYREEYNAVISAATATKLRGPFLELDGKTNSFKSCTTFSVTFTIEGTKTTYMTLCWKGTCTGPAPCPKEYTYCKEQRPVVSSFDPTTETDEVTVCFPVDRDPSEAEVTRAV